jgi:hypothetical protein
LVTLGTSYAIHCSFYALNSNCPSIVLEGTIVPAYCKP